MAQIFDGEHAEGERPISFSMELNWTVIERNVANAECISKEEATEILQQDGVDNLSAETRDYLCRARDGKITKPRGRQRFRGLPRVIFNWQNLVIRALYNKYFERLNERKRKYGWTKFDRTPAEIAARIVARRFWYGAESYRTVQNIAAGG